MKQLRCWHLSALKVISDPMSALARTSERDGRTRTTNENCTANESWTRTKYAYDSANHMISLAGGGAQVGYTYDALNRPATVTEANTGATNYTYDGIGNLSAGTS